MSLDGEFPACRIVSQTIRITKNFFEGNQTDRRSAVTSVVLRRIVPVSPGAGVVGEPLSGDVAECLKRQSMRRGIERGIVGVVQQLWDGGEALLGRVHAGLGEAAGGPLTDAERWIVMHRVEQRLDGLTGAGHC